CGEAEEDRRRVWAGERTAVQLCRNDWEAGLWIDGPAVLSPVGRFATGPDDLLDRGWSGTDQCVWGEAGDAAAGLCSCWADHCVGRERAWQQRASVAIYRGGR